MHEVTGGTLEARVQQTRPGNSENGKREWSANMAIRLVKNRKRKASRTSRIPRTYKKEIATHHFVEQKPIISMGKYKLQKTRSQ